MSPCMTLHLIFLSSMLDIITSEKKYAENIAGNYFPASSIMTLYWIMQLLLSMFHDLLLVKFYGAPWL